MVVGAVAGLCVLADQGARRLRAGAPDPVAAREARAVADPVTTGSIRQAPSAQAQAPAPSSDGLDRRGLAVLMSSGAANAVAAPPAKRKPDAVAQRSR